jgi:hypothetical protein
MGRKSREKQERRHAKAERFRERQKRAQEGTVRGCVICRGHDGGFLSEEHPVPESLGNTEIVLPNGVVCDRCNHGALSNLDQTLQQFFPIAIQRVLKGIPSKAGKLPTARFRNGVLGLSSPGNIVMNTSERKALIVDPVPLPDGYQKMKMTVTGGRRLTPTYASELSRSLLKMAIECAWLDHGEKILEPEWDHVREAILGERRAGYFTCLRTGDPNDNHVQLQYWPVIREDGSLIVAVVVRLYGLVMATDSRNPKPIMPLDPDEAIVIKFGSDLGARSEVA